MQTITLPEVGKIYRSTAEPGFAILVEAVYTIEADEDHDAGFSVEGCAPEHRGQTGEIGYDFTAEEWAEHGFSPESERRQG